MYIWGKGRAAVRVGSDFLTAIAGRVGSTFRRVGSGPRKVTRGQTLVYPSVICCCVQEAQAEEQRMASRYANDIEISKAQRDFELKKAAYDQEVHTKQAQSDMAYELQVGTTCAGYDELQVGTYAGYDELQRGTKNYMQNKLQVCSKLSLIVT